MFLLSTSCATPIPTPELTTRRYNSYNGYNKTYTILGSPKFNTTGQKTSLVPQNFNIKSKKTKNDTELIHSFIKNNVEDLRFPNKTLKIKKVTTKPKISQKNKQPVKLVIEKNKKIGNSRRNQTTSQFNRKQPSVFKISASKLSENHSKEDWSVHNIPIPNPNPVVSSYSPEYPVGTIPSFDEDDSIVILPSDPGNMLTQSVFNVNGNGAGEKYDSNCPTVHLTNSVLGPESKQGCSDLNIAINTHIHQNQIPQRLPSSPSDEILETASSGGTPNAVVPPPTLAAAAPLEAAAADPIGSAVGGGSAGSSGGGGPLSGGLPSLPELPKLPKLPDLKQILEFLKFLGPGLGFLREVLKALSPLVYIVPLVSFIIGFISILPLYPWWLPLLFLFGKSKEPSRPKTEIVYHKHVHKPIHHHDGWFWNSGTQTWVNVEQRAYARSDLDFNLFT
ncbi:uncharacterized protein LOC116169046 [Photinus pyralis]|nr:uncharacterized protein LOC116169046 [Photinus pyralis]